MTDKSAQILLAEDDPSLRTIIQFNLEAAGFRTTPAFNGREAWELAQQNQFDLVLTDHGMPEIVGVDLCRRLRKDDRYTETPLMLMSALCKDLDLPSISHELRLAAVLPEPFSVTQLVGTIRECLATNAVQPKLGT